MFTFIHLSTLLNGCITKWKLGVRGPWSITGLTERCWILFLTAVHPEMVQLQLGVPKTKTEAGNILIIFHQAGNSVSLLLTVFHLSVVVSGVQRCDY